MRLTTIEFELITKRTHKREFLDKMHLLIPWSELLWMIAPHTLQLVAATKSAGCYGWSSRKAWTFCGACCKQQV